MDRKIVKQIAHVCIFAHDIDETAAWYEKVLGFQKIFNFTRDGRPFGYYLDAGGNTHVEVFEKAESKFAETDQINHICFEVIDIDFVIDHVRALGYPAKDKSKGCDDTWQSWITDPNGVKIELFQYTPLSAQFTGRDRVAHW
ncbi:MAG: VOC family protein [Alphaproteobacteria bacterium]|nr:VOC family protein [Alphaproteobacteria bacterium]